MLSPCGGRLPWCGGWTARSTARFQPGERKIVAFAAQRAGEGIRGGIALAGGALDARTAWVGQTQQPRDLVEGFARRVVDGAAQVLVLAVPADQHDLAVPARNDQTHDGELRRRAVLGQQQRVDVAFQVIHADQRQIAAQRQSFRVIHADQQRSGQTRPARYGDGVDVI